MSRPRNRCTERGFSLVEMTMAFAIFIFAALAAYALYAAGTRSFRKAENATDLQQNARTGFDQMVRELRLAGFNTNADGTPTRPDEQIEGAWDTAVSIRADFDFEDASKNTTPETSLAGTFNIVTTGNDEIVTFALGKPTPAAGSAFGFVADVGDTTRNGTDEAVALPGAVLVQDARPTPCIASPRRTGWTSSASTASSTSSTSSTSRRWPRTSSRSISATTTSPAT